VTVGLFFRKTKRVGRHSNVTLTKRGASVSTGARGVRISSRGWLTIGRGPLRFRKKLF
jgi:hypothetical protein